MFTKIILALVSFMLTSAALAAQLGVTLTVSPASTLMVSPGSGGDTPFTALHTYYISPTGSDSNNGTSAATPWLTPNHSVVCGDVIIAAAGAYSSANFDSYTKGSSLYGSPANCPSTTGGIDGAGGIYFATIVCGGVYVGACTINASTPYAMYVDSSNWAIEGFQATDNNNGGGECFRTAPRTATANIAFIAFINDIAANCPLAGFASDGLASNNAYSVDEFAAVGDIAFNASQSASESGSGFGDNIPTNVNNLSGTHVFFSQDFSYGNIDGPCSANSLFKGAYTNMAANAAAGSSTISVAAVSGWGANWPIGAANGANYPSASPAIVTTGATPMLVSSVTGTTIGLNNNVAAPGLTNGELLAIGTSSDGEGLIFDTWYLNAYTGKAAVENNVFWNNGAHGFEMFCGASTCATALNVTLTQNTMYCNAQDYKRDGTSWEIYDGESVSGTFTFTVTNNLAQTCVAKPYGSVTEAAWNNVSGSGSSGVGLAGTGQPVVAAGFGRTGITVSGNYFDAVPGVACPIYATCSGPNNDLADYNGASYASGNILGVPPGFASPGSLPKTAPNCSSYTNVVGCMNTGYGVAAALTSSAAPSKGYQAPAGACQPDANYPTWLKGIVYLYWTGSAVVQQHGLVTTPCGL
jgi:hypothetical protein